MQIPVIISAFVLLAGLLPERTEGHEGHSHGEVPGEKPAAAAGPVTLSAQAIQNLGIKTVEAEIKPLERSFSMPARVVALPEKDAKIAARFEGTISELLVKLGDRVAAGQPVLIAKPIQTGSPDVALKSPIAGEVARLSVTLGQSFAPGDTLIEVVDLAEVLARGETFQTPEIFKLRNGQSVWLSVDGFPERTFQGFIQRIDVGLEESSRTFELFALIGNPERELRPNLAGTLKASLGEPQEVLAIPERAVLGSDGDYFVFVRTGDAFERRSVVLGMRSGDQVEILEGVFPGESVVVSGNYQLQYAQSTKPAAAASEPEQAEDQKPAAVVLSHLGPWIGGAIFLALLVSSFFGRKAGES